jgi:hypothetical protein
VPVEGTTSGDWSDEDASLLAGLEEEERAVSTERRRLHDRIDNWGGTDELLERERELSRHRRELHARIDELRARRDARSER